MPPWSTAAEVAGQSQIARSAGIDRVWLTPEGVAASDDARRAIAEADVIVIGPGSLYTSILPSLLLPALTEAIRSSSALRVCTSATWPRRRARRRATTWPIISPRSNGTSVRG